jgi:hypothetical protein
MKIKALFLSIMLILFVAAFVQAQNSLGSDPGPISPLEPLIPDPGIPDTVRAESKTLPSGTAAFTIDVTLYNDEEIGGFNLPVSWSSVDLTCDSVSWVGSRVEANSIPPMSSIDNDNQRLQAGYIAGFFDPPLQPGEGLLYTIYFTVAPGVTDLAALIDSTFFPPAGNFALTTATGFNFDPQFQAGNVVIGTPPAPEIGLSPAALTFDGIEGAGNPSSKILNIANTGTGTLNWTASDDALWLSLNPTSGSGDGSTTVSVDIAGLSAGTYNGTITVSDPAASNDPQTVPVTLNVAPPKLYR